MALPKFTKTDNTYSVLTFNSGRAIDDGEEYIPNQIKTKTGGNIVHVVDHGEAEQIIPCHFLALTPTVYANLIGFLKDDTVRWSGDTFKFTDEASVDYNNARFWSDRIKTKELASGHIEVEFDLRIE